jgi:hypothetical protein
VCDPSQIGDMRIWNAREGWFLADDGGVICNLSTPNVKLLHYSTFTLAFSTLL